MFAKRELEILALSLHYSRVSFLFAAPSFKVEVEKKIEESEIDTIHNKIIQELKGVL